MRFDLLYEKFCVFRNAELFLVGFEELVQFLDIKLVQLVYLFLRGVGILLDRNRRSDHRVNRPPERKITECELKTERT